MILLMFVDHVNCAHKDIVIQMYFETVHSCVPIRPIYKTAEFSVNEEGFSIIQMLFAF